MANKAPIPEIELDVEGAIDEAGLMILAELLVDLAEAEQDEQGKTAADLARRYAR